MIVRLAAASRLIAAAASMQSCSPLYPEDRQPGAAVTPSSPNRIHGSGDLLRPPGILGTDDLP
jgi:hypothetical protein